MHLCGMRNSYSSDSIVMQSRAESKRSKKKKTLSARVKKKENSGCFKYPRSSYSIFLFKKTNKKTKKKHSSLLRVGPQSGNEL